MIAADPVAKEQATALAHGQEPREPTRPAPPDGRASAGGGLRGSFGRAFTEQVADGWYGRLELEGFGAAPYASAGWLAGALIGGELWVAPDAGGGGMPLSVFVGFRTPGLYGTLGFGADLFLVDEVADDAGFGVYAPFASSALGVELPGFRLLADARLQYRWQWGAPDRAHLQLGLTMVHFFEAPLRSSQRRVEAQRRERAYHRQTW